MFQWKRNKVEIFIGALLLASIGARWIERNKEFSHNFASENIQEFTPQQIAAAEWSVSPLDFQNPDPNGRSYFDYVFSNTVGAQRVYDVPYPFDQALSKVKSYMGYHDTEDPLSVAIFPMGRSLQRNAAFLGDTSPQHDLNLFFRYPRIVAGVNLEPRKLFSLNLQGRLYLGFHEKAEIIEAISYNDEEGRFEYQVVRDYAPGKTPKVSYANRTLCLSCHQNQTPIFSQPPWSESNANPEMATLLQNNLPSQSHDSYFGAKVKVDANVPYSIDTLTDRANLFHAYQKMWLSVCPNLDCQKNSLRSLISFLLSNKEGVVRTAQNQNFLNNFEKDFRTRFPGGLKIPSPNIPNRDPLHSKQDSVAQIENELNQLPSKVKGDIQDLISKSTVPGQFEPLLTRAPIELWNTSDIDNMTNINHMILGFSDFFTLQDIKWLSIWVAKVVDQNSATPVKQLHAHCSIQNDTTTGNISAQCLDPKGDFIMQNATFGILNNRIIKSDIEYLILYSASSCDRALSQSTSNRLGGAGCPAFLSASATGQMVDQKINFRILNTNGLPSHFLNELRVQSASLDTQTGDFALNIVDDSTFINASIDAWKATQSPFSRKKILLYFAKLMGAQFENPDLSTLEKNVESDVAIDPSSLAKVSNPAQAFAVSCSMCHYNFEGVPPAFLGLKQQPINSDIRCRRIEICAPRMLYRLKMRNCSADQIKVQKNPMPIPAFFIKSKIDPVQWQAQIANAKIIPFLTKIVNRTDLTNALVSKGVNASVAAQSVKELVESACPNVDATVYESLPACEFQSLKQNSQCNQLLSSFGTVD